MKVRFIDNEISHVGEEISALLQSGNYKNFRAAVAYMRNSGLGTIYEDLQAFKGSGGEISVIAGIDQKNTSYQALSNLLPIAGANLYVHHVTSLYETFHPKVYIFGKERDDIEKIIVGSSNLTAGGFYKNVEASIAIDFSEDADAGNDNVFDFKASVENFWERLCQSRNTKQASQKILEQLTGQGLLFDERQNEDVLSTVNSIMGEGEFSGQLFGASDRQMSRIPSQNLPDVSRAPNPKGRFAMTLSSFDTSDKSQDPVILLPLQALRENANFWNFPVRYKPSRKNFLEYYTKVEIRNGGVTQDIIRLYAYSGKSEFRIQCPGVKRGGSQGDIMEIEKIDIAQDHDDKPHLEYRITLHKKTSQEHGKILKRLHTAVSHVKKYGYF